MVREARSRVGVARSYAPPVEMRPHLVDSPNRKATGAYYTPPTVAAFLAGWVGPNARSVLDPSCGDGRFLAGFQNATGVDLDLEATRTTERLDSSPTVINDDFFRWALATEARFDAALGNPPFIRYQRFRGATRERALELCKRAGVEISGLTSSWAPFIVGAATLLNRNGRMSFVVPAEIAHAVYARPVVSWLIDNFAHVEVVAVREKLFPELSEDCWLLRTAGYGAPAEGLHFFRTDRFTVDESSWEREYLTRPELRKRGYRLRSFLLPRDARAVYEQLASSDGVQKLGDLATLGIGYVTGANDFFHLRPSQVKRLKIPAEVLSVAVRSNRDLSGIADVTEQVISRWLAEDRPIMLLDLGGRESLPPSVRAYLGTPEAVSASLGYKCRNRKPWYVVPDVRPPDAFLSIMANGSPRLVQNSGGAVCTNSVHAVRLFEGVSISSLVEAWSSPVTALSCELEGHALGGGLLKLEPNEAKEVIVPIECDLDATTSQTVERALQYLQRWRDGS